MKKRMVKNILPIKENDMESNGHKHNYRFIYWRQTSKIREGVEIKQRQDVFCCMTCLEYKYVKIGKPSSWRLYNEFPEPPMKKENWLFRFLGCDDKKTEIGMS